jgi:hypothetical protein
MKFSYFRRMLEPWGAKADNPFVSLCLSKLALAGGLTSNWTKRWNDKVANYADHVQPVDVARARDSLMDEGISFFLRMMREGDYQTMIDVGGLDGFRAIRIKDLLPEAEVYAVDISPSYREPRDIEGV